MVKRGFWIMGLLALQACSSDSNKPPAAAPPPDAGDSGDGAQPTEFGLDERPSNGSCVAPDRPAITQVESLTFQPRFGDMRFRFPTGLAQAPGDSGRVYVIEKQGIVRVVRQQGEAWESSVFLDASSQVNADATEAGLLGIAFHPNFAQNRFVYLSYTQSGDSPSGLESVVARYTADATGDTASPDSRKVIFGPVDQPYNNHNGGHIAFGPDGYLYVGLGDGGSSGDPQDNAQNPGSRLGKILRLDVDGGDPYAIPPTNPYAQGGGAPEVYALGFRNPWRFNFDRETGELWVGDVGQNDWEEINKVVLGGNYGWNVREGAHCYDASSCPTEGFIDPVAEYSHSEGISVTGGFVYRGAAMPGLQGTYLYADYGTGKLWGIASTGGQPRLLNPSGPNPQITSFGEELDGELDIVDGGGGQIYRLASPEATPSNFPELLSQTGCFKPEDPTQVADGVIGYDMNAPLWSDGADKERYFAIPDGTTIGIKPDGDWDFPVGSVTIKTFLIAGKRVETRLFVRHKDGAWGGYTYEWNAEQTDARLLASSKTVQVEGQSWYFPSRGQCFRCHTAAAGDTLGPETGQLNRDFVYPTGRRANQLATLGHIGMFTEPLGAAPSELIAFPAADSSAPVHDRAKAYLHSNCSSCHRPESTGQGPMDFRYGTALGAMRVCNEPPLNGTLGVDGARILVPRDPGRSLISLRMHTLQAGRMPPLASSRVDEQGTQLIDGWIEAIESCP